MFSLLNLLNWKAIKDLSPTANLVQILIMQVKANKSKMDQQQLSYKLVKISN